MFIVLPVTTEPAEKESTGSVNFAKTKFYNRKYIFLKFDITQLLCTWAVPRCQQKCSDPILILHL